jgi:hypothetical protein
MPVNFKGDIICKKLNGGFNTGLNEQFTNFIFWLLNKISRITVKTEGILSTSQLITDQHKTNCRSFLSQPDGLN